MTRREKMCARIGDQISAHRQTHGRNSITRIYISKPLYRLLSGINWDDIPKERRPSLFNIEIKAFDSDKMEYSFAGVLYEAKEV